MSCSRLFIPIFLLVSPAACAETLQSGGHTVNKSETEDAFWKVRKQAELNSGCGFDNIKVEVSEADGSTATAITAKGCGKSQTYVRSDVPSGWEMGE